MKASRKAIVALTLLIAVSALAAVSFPNWHWYPDPQQIESRLLAETPIGSTEDQVLTHLRAKGIEAAPVFRGVVAPNTGYPPNTIAGSSFTHAVVGEYSPVFTTYVEAFYIFGPDRRLVEIAVRKTTDAP